MSHTARIAVIGAGWWATYAHMPALKANPDAELVAIADIDAEKLARAAEYYDIETTYTDYRDMLERETLDGAVIAVWHAAHYEVARACLDRGLHIVLEKPMVLRAAHARDLCESADAGNQEIIMSYPWNYLLQTRRAREVAQSGGIGKIHYIADIFSSSPYTFYKGDDNADNPVMAPIYPVTGPGDVYADPERSGGGQGCLQVTHSAALMCFITGLKPVAVQAQMSNLDVSVDVTDAITVRLDNGALATIGSTGTVCSGEGKLDVQVYGDRGWIDLDYITNTGVIRYADGDDEELLTSPETDYQGGNPVVEYLYPSYAPANNLVDVILGRDENRSPGEIGWRTVEILDAAYRSAGQDGKMVGIDSLYDGRSPMGTLRSLRD